MTITTNVAFVKTNRPQTKMAGEKNSPAIVLLVRSCYVVLSPVFLAAFPCAGVPSARFAPVAVSCTSR